MFLYYRRKYVVHDPNKVAPLIWIEDWSGNSSVDSIIFLKVPINFQFLFGIYKCSKLSKVVTASYLNKFLCSNPLAKKLSVYLSLQ